MQHKDNKLEGSKNTNSIREDREHFKFLTQFTARGGKVHMRSASFKTEQMQDFPENMQTWANFKTIKY